MLWFLWFKVKQWLHKWALQSSQIKVNISKCSAQCGYLLRALLLLDNDASVSLIDGEVCKRCFKLTMNIFLFRSFIPPFGIWKSVWQIEQVDDTRHLKQKLWLHGNILGSSIGLSQILQMTIEKASITLGNQRRGIPAYGRIYRASHNKHFETEILNFHFGCSS